MYVHRIEGHRYDGIFGHGRLFRREARRIRKEYGIETLKTPEVEYLNQHHHPQWWEKALSWQIIELATAGLERRQKPSAEQAQ